MQRAFEVPVLLGSLLSLCLCSWLLCCSLRKVSERASSRLLLKQIVALARADVVTALVGLVLSIGNLRVIPASIGVKTCWILNNVVWTFWNWGLCVSTLVEVHIAAAIFARALHKDRVLASLKCGLPLVWIAAFAFAMTDALLVRANAGYDNEKQVCVWSSHVGVGFVDGGFSAPIVCAVAAVSLVVNVVVYTSLNFMPTQWFQKSVAPKSAEHIQKLMLRYCLTAVFTWLPFWVVASTGRSAPLFWAEDWCSLAIALPMSLNGALNVWAYSSHSRHSRKLWAAYYASWATGDLEGSPGNEPAAAGFRSSVDFFEIPCGHSCSSGTSRASVTSPSASEVASAACIADGAPAA